jgi:predicted enzyme related to lactoylglutathione lyase
MDALYPRLLVDDFEATARFYEAALRALLGVEPSRFVPEAEYASWDFHGEGVLAVMGRARMEAATGTDTGAGAGASPTASGRGQAMLVFRVDDVDTAAKTLAGLGAAEVAPPTDRPDWGPTMRTAHLRDPEGTLLELQSY